MATLAQLVVKITGDTGQLEGALGRAEKKTAGLGGAVGKLGSKMGTALKAGGLLAAGGLGVAAVAGVKFVGVASDLNESMSKAEVVFGKNAAEIKKWAATAAKSFGQSKQEALEAAGTFGNLFSALGLTGDESKRMSMDIVELSADLASFNNIAGSDALEKLRAGLVGEAEPLRTLGVNITAATTDAKAMELGFRKVNGTFTEAQKVQARYALILDQTKNAQGDFARTSDGLANKQRILSAQWKDTQAIIGTGLMPIMIAFGGVLSDFLTKHQPEIERFSLWMGEKIPVAINATGNALERAEPMIASTAASMAEGFKTIRPGLEWIINNKIALVAALTAVGVAGVIALTPISAPVLAAIAALAALLVATGYVRSQWKEWREDNGLLGSTIRGLELEFRALEAAINGIIAVVTPATEFIRKHESAQIALKFSIASVVAMMAPFIAAIAAGALAANALANVWGTVTNVFDKTRDSIQWVIDRIYQLIEAINRIPTPGDVLGGIIKKFDPRKLFAAGGFPPAGEPVIVGDQGPEIAAFPGGTRIYSNRESRAMAQSAPSGGNVVHLTVNAYGNQDNEGLVRLLVRRLREELQLDTLAGPRLPVSAFSPRRA